MIENPFILSMIETTLRALFDLNQTKHVNLGGCRAKGKQIFEGLAE